MTCPSSTTSPKETSTVTTLPGMFAETVPLFFFFEPPLLRARGAACAFGTSILKDLPSTTASHEPSSFAVNSTSNSTPSAITVLYSLICTSPWAATTSLSHKR